ncbi:putative transport-related membrane protein [Flavobacterium frigoris PS1]|uniref:Transport-related membrane protein n=2 Tax=Flavobacterium frigoris TaxID=229204 RepID=H7FP16_FLAFP|nr:putative transport-related membrane protein [Flavobacterium frigoris PS1]
MDPSSSAFKSWVPKWCIMLIIFLVILPAVSMLSGYVGGITSAASYYGLDPTDIQFSIVLYYVGIASFFPLEKRFFGYFSSKTYFLMTIVLFVSINFLLYITHDPLIFFMLRFLGGAVTVGIIGVTLNLIFSQFHSERSRVLGYAVFYGTLLSSNSFVYLLDAYLFQNHDYNVLYLIMIYLQVPGVLLMLLCLKTNFRLHSKRIPLFDLDWKSFIIYSSLLSLTAYLILYGQYYNWFDSIRIWICSSLILGLLILFVLTQLKQKRPFIDLGIYKYRNFRIGVVLLVLYYICKGDVSVANTFIFNNMGLDTYHYAYIMFFNAFGIVVGIGVTARFLLAKRKIRLMWLTGFAFLLVYHILMFFIFGPQANEKSLLIPLFFQGMGNGVLMLSIVLFMIKSVPESKSFSASLSGVSFRFFAFTISLAFVSFMNLRQASVHYHELGNTITALNTASTQQMQLYENIALTKGASTIKAKIVAKKMFGKAVSKHVNILFARDYYSLMAIVIFFIMLAIALIPSLHYHFRKIGSRVIPI